MKIKKSLIKKIAETFNEYFVAIAENLKRQSKINHINDDNDNMDSHNHFMEQAFTNLNQVWNVNAQQQKKLNVLKNPSKQEIHMGTMRYLQRY